MTAEVPPADVPPVEPGTRVEVALGVPRASAGELWELMWRSTLVPEWLGEGSTVPTRTGQRLVLSDRAGAWRRGRVVGVRWGVSVEAVLDRAEGWPAQPSEDRLSIAISAQPDGGVSVQIAESGPYVDAHRAEIELYWQAVLVRLDGLRRRVDGRRDNPRQAVIVIHGIGEQEPGRTLRALAASGVIGSADARSFVKPDRVSGSFELR